MATEKNKGDGSIDAESKEILDEMEAEGIDTSSLTGKEAGEGSKELQETDDETSEEEDSEEESDTDADDKSEDEEEEEGDKSSDTDSEGEDDDEDEDEEDSEEGDEEDQKPKGKKTLVQKYRSTRKLLKETQETLAALQSSKSDEAFDAELKAFAEKNNMNIEVARGLIDFAARRSKLPKAVLDDIQRSRAERRNTDYWADQHKKFETDFKSNVLPVLQQFEMSEEEIQGIQEQLNNDPASPFYAWDKKNKTKSLVALALGIRRAASSGGKTQNRVTSEGGRANNLNRGKSAKNEDEVTSEDIDNMSDEEFDSYSDKLGKKSKSVVHRS